MEVRKNKSRASLGCSFSTWRVERQCRSIFQIDSVPRQAFSQSQTLNCSDRPPPSHSPQRLIATSPRSPEGGDSGCQMPFAEPDAVRVRSIQTEGSLPQIDRWRRPYVLDFTKDLHGSPFCWDGRLFRVNQ
ncbi:hypothetical protein Pla52n_61620 [Stieleria varia]|uniref:Uncharacterized protein n=1 Tax=Stieleria varia TaxID=2528005 RepID=A0A5C6A0F7_9BACT|nr:hypothetical protein Pla52n_61620 [Stieleria varia]